MKVRDQDAVIRSIRKLFERMLNAKDPKLALQDVEDILIPREHRDIAHKAVSIMGMRRSSSLTAFIPYKTKKVQVEFVVKGATWFWPDRGHSGLPDGWEQCPLETKERVLSWLEWREKLSAEWGLVEETFRKLHASCTNIEQIRFYWPALPTLLDMDPAGTGKDTAEKMREFKYPKNVPTLHPALKQTCQDTMATITKGLLFPDGERPQREVQLVLNSTYYAFEPVQRPWGPSGNKFWGP
jgi:hypothetical protein